VSTSDDCYDGGEQLGSSSMDSALLRHGAKDHFFRAAICRMCQDLQDGANAVGKYEQMCPAFTDSRECKLLKVSALRLFVSAFCDFEITLLMLLIFIDLCFI